MTYSMKRFMVSAASGQQGTYFADVINQFLAVNPTISPVALSITWRYGRSRSDQFYLNFTYRGGSVPIRSWCTQFQSSPTITAEAQAVAFFAVNPTYLPVLTQVVSRPGIVTTSRRLLIIFQTSDNAQPSCVRQAIVAAPQASVAIGAWGTMFDPSDFSRPPVPVLNLGNHAWPAGGVNMAISRIGNSPDLCAFGGIAPGCFAGSTFTTPVPSVPTLLCGHCLPTDLPTVSSTGTFSTSSTSTTTTTSTTTSSTTSSTTTSTTTTSTTSSTTTTAGGPCTACSGSQTFALVSGAAGLCAVANGTYTFTVFNPGSTCAWEWTLGAGPWHISLDYSGGAFFELLVSDGVNTYQLFNPPGISCVGGQISGTASVPNTAGGCGGSVTVVF